MKKPNISFEIRTLNDFSPFENLSARVTLADHDGRLFYFNNHLMSISDGKLSVGYIFPDDGDIELYCNYTKMNQPFQ